MVEQRAFNPFVGGSSPSGFTFFLFIMKDKTINLSEIALMSEEKLLDILDNDESLQTMNISGSGKQILEYLVIKKYLNEGYQIIVGGILEITPDGFGLLRTHPKFLTSPCDIYVKHIIIRKLRLKNGDTFSTYICPSKSGEKFFTIADISSLIKIFSSKLFFNLRNKNRKYFCLKIENLHIC